MVRVAIVRFPGSNCDEDARRGAEQSGADAFFVWHRDTSLQGADVVVLPGGFSYGDYLRSGAIARFSPVMQAVQAHAAAGGAVIGICNGFQILCEAHMLPGALMRNAGLTFVSKPVDVMVERLDTALTWAFDRKTQVRLPVAHGEGRYAADAETLTRLEGEGQVMLRYMKAGAGVEGNPNGSINDIAGICNAAGNIVGLMPHPERVVDPRLGSADGLLFLRSIAGVRPLAGAAR